MDVFTVSMFGHRRVVDSVSVERALERLVRQLLLEKEYVEFLLGRDGDFDLLAAAVIRRCKQTVRDDNSAMVWVMPYLKAEYKRDPKAFLDYYDEIEVCEPAAYFKTAFRNRNRQMVDRSDLAVFYVEEPRGGAFETMRYAEERKIAIVCLSERT